MLTPTDDARLRDRLCVILLEATSPPAVLVRLRTETRPVYDPCPDAFLGRDGLLQPRDVYRACRTCGERFVVSRRGGDHVYCSQRCGYRARAQPARVLVRQRYPAAGVAS